MLQFTKSKQISWEFMTEFFQSKKGYILGGIQTDYGPWQPQGDLFTLLSSLLELASGQLRSGRSGGRSGTTGRRWPVSGAFEKL